MQTPYHWAHRTAFSYAWYPASMIYWAIASLRSKRIKPARLAVPIICVGNNTIGGSGKTPTVIALCALLQQQGKKVHVISRGYKGRYAGTVKVDAAVHIAQEVGDEPLLISRYAPCWVARKRIHAAHAAIADGAEILIMDDGLQNPSLHKDFTLVVIDGTFGFGSGFMLPAGPCREPIARSMAKANAVLIIGEETNDTIRKHIPQGKEIVTGMLQPTSPLDLKGVRVHPFAGIGMPDKFFKTVQQMGADITLTSRFDDHHNYTTKDIETLLKESSDHHAQLVTTQKDYVRLPEAFQEQVVVVEVALHITQSDALLARLDALYA